MHGFRFYVALAVLDGSDIATFLVSNDDLMDLLCPASYEGLRKKVLTVKNNYKKYIILL